MIELKKALSALLAAIMLMPLSACENNSDTTAEDTTPEAATAEPPATDDTHVEETAADETEAEESLTPGIDSLTDEDKIQYTVLAAQNAERANVLGSVIEKYYARGRGSNIVFSMYINTDTMFPSNTASVWHITSALSMASKLWAVDAGGNGSGFRDLHEKTYNAMQYYKGTAPIVNYNGTKEQTMYAVNRAPAVGSASLADVAAVYDDQMWIIRELVYCYKLTGDEKYLNEALQLTDVCLDAWDTSPLGDGEVGGIDWGPGYSSKHTCSNAPLIKPLVEIYEIFRDEGRENAEYYLDWAVKIYEWTNDQLRLPNGIYGDLVRPKNRKMDCDKWQSKGPLGSLDTATYSYNTGAMISAAAALYRAVGDTSYLDDATRSAKSAYKNFTVTATVDGESVKQYSAYPREIYRSNTWFNLILLEGFIDLYPYDPECKNYIDTYQQSLDYAYEHHLTDKGLMPRDLYNGWNKTKKVSSSDSRCPDLEKDIMDQSSMAEMYAVLSALYSSVSEK